MRSPNKGRKPQVKLDDNRPNTTIVCMACSEKKAIEGSKSFRAFKICALCVKTLEQLDK